MPCELLRIVDAEGILLEYAHLPKPLLGLYSFSPGEVPVILLHNKIRSKRRLLRCVLAEELGHHYTSSGNLLAFARSDKAVITLKQEYQALWWAAQRLIPPARLAEVIEAGLFLTHELAECFDVTPGFMETSLKIYRGKGYSLNVKKPQEGRHLRPILQRQPARGKHRRTDQGHYRLRRKEQYPDR